MMTLEWLDWTVLIGYFLLVAALGTWMGRREKDTHDFFLGARRQHWLLAGLSIVATEVSALTFIVVPADAFKGDWTYLQMYAGAVVGRLIIVFMLLPAFYGGAVTTVYQYLGQRFGPATQTTAALCFMASRVIGSSIRLLAASLALSEVFGWPLTEVVLGAAALTVLYTAFGGIKAILWTDALQALVFLGAAASALIFLFHATPASLGEDLSLARDCGKFHVFNWSQGPGVPVDKLFWFLMINATFTNVAALGTDQDLTQRMLTCPDLKRSRRSLIFNMVMGLPVVCLFLLIGAMLFVYYQAFPDQAPPATLPSGQAFPSDRVFPYFIARSLPSGWGLKGFLVAGIFACAMSSLDSALGALSSSAVIDLYKPRINPRLTERRALILARVFVVAFGAILAGVALAFRRHDELLWEVFRWASLVFGALLGVFMAGVTTTSRGADRINALAMLSSIALLVLMKYWTDSAGNPYVPWPWWIVIGTAWTYGISVTFPSRREKWSSAG